MRTAVDACLADTGLVVELGSGCGLNVLDIYVWGGPARARYCGLELSQSGRECAQNLAALEAGLDFQSIPFNYYAPNYTILPEETGHVLVFSSHSIEQIRILPERTITGLLDRYPSVTGVHFEPIG